MSNTFGRLRDLKAALRILYPHTDPGDLTLGTAYSLEALRLVLAWKIAQWDLLFNGHPVGPAEYPEVFMRASDDVRERLLTFGQIWERESEYARYRGTDYAYAIFLHLKWVSARLNLLAADKCTSDPKPTKRRRGRPPTKPFSAHKALVDDWNAASKLGTSKKDFCDKRGIKTKQLGSSQRRVREVRQGSQN